MSEMKYCSHCRKNLPVSEFGIDRHKPDGLNVLCKKSIKTTGALRRQAKRAKRKPMILARSWKQRIKEAVRRSDGTRESIQELTGIPWDGLCDLLAEMTFDDNELLLDAKAGKFRLAA